MLRLKFTTDNVIRQLRWVALLVMLLDAVFTVAGQPSSFWTNPATTNEGSPIVHFFLSHGIIPFAVGGILYVTGVLMIASIAPRKVALALLFYLILGHFFGMSTWVIYYFRKGHGMLELFEVGIAVLIAFAICRQKMGHQDT